MFRVEMGNGRGFRFRLSKKQHAQNIKAPYGLLARALEG